jgi:uncharacterized protein DUF6677
MTTKTAHSMNIPAGIAALVFPGAGHFFVLGQRKRGLLAAVGVLGLFFGGMFIGGIDVIDRQEDKYWFLGQALVGPLAFGVNTIHQNNYKAYDIPPPIVALERATAEVASKFVKRSLHANEQRKIIKFTIVEPNGVEVTKYLPVAYPAGPDNGPPAAQSIGRMNELGMLSSTLGGMLNFIIILDALFPTRRREDS